MFEYIDVKFQFKIKTKATTGAIGTKMWMTQYCALFFLSVVTHLLHKEIKNWIFGAVKLLIKIYFCCS